MRLVALRTLSIADSIAEKAGHRVRTVIANEKFDVADDEAGSYISRKLARKVDAKKDAPAEAEAAPEKAAPSTKKAGK